jgi:hypothetical protein
MSQQSRNWLFTSFDLDFNPKLTDPLYYIYQVEVCPETNRKHLQGYIEFKHGVRLSRLKRINSTVHWETRRGSRDQARAYCSKEETREENSFPIEWGQWREQGRRSDLHSLAEDIRERQLTHSQVAEEYGALAIRYSRGINDYIAATSTPYTPEGLRGIWIVGVPGSGKTRSVEEQFAGDLYVKSVNKWWDGYQGESNVLLDDLCPRGQFLGHNLKIWSDRYARRGEIKGGSVNLAHDRFIVTSQYTIEEIFQVIYMSSQLINGGMVIKVNPMYS